MYITELFEAQEPSSILVVYPGRFQPWHKGHKMVYDYLVRVYGRDNVFIATSNKVDPPRSPFTFNEKQQFMHLTGVNADRIVETRDPYRALELVQKYNPKTTRLVLAVSEKDMAEDPRFKFGFKKDGSPTYLQAMPKNVNDMQPFENHGYIMTVPTFDFTVLGLPMKSATEVRAQFSQADEATQQAIIKDLFGAYDRHIHDIMKQKLAQPVAESAVNVAVGTKLNLVKNYGNFKTLTGVVKDVTPGGKLKIQITQAETEPGKKGAVKVGDVLTMASNYIKSTVVENFDDGKNPQDKGDAKRHGINTKASVSSLRKTAKAGGRKGQLAHWLANMKSGRAKAKNEGVAEGLNEFAPGGNSASSYYAVTANFVNDFAQQKQEELQDLIDAGWTKQDLAQAGTLQGHATDIVHFEQVRDGFLKGLKPGFDAYLQGDTQLKDQLGEYWIDNDLPLNQDWEKIYGEPWGRDEYDEGIVEGNMKPTHAAGAEKPGAVAMLEKVLLKAKQRGIKLNYDNIDKMMQLICNKHNLTGDKLHDDFVNKHNMIPDNWIKKQGIAEGDENQYLPPNPVEVARIRHQTLKKLNPVGSQFIWKRPNEIGGSFKEQDLISKGFKKSRYDAWGGTQYMWDRLYGVKEDLNQPTPTAQEVLNKHNMTVDSLMSQLRLGVKIELEHTKDAKTAYEIALDHLNERPDYYTALSKAGLEEDAAGVGVVAKNKKMAKDPRYSTSMTVDVQPSTPAKNMKALRLIK